MCVADVGYDAGKKLRMPVKELAQNCVDMHAPITTIHPRGTANDVVRDEYFHYFLFPGRPPIFHQYT
jgi:hypothetical protein